jgi:hypothetical protein
MLGKRNPGFERCVLVATSIDRVHKGDRFQPLTAEGRPIPTKNPTGRFKCWSSLTVYFAVLAAAVGYTYALSAFSFSVGLQPSG